MSDSKALLEAILESQKDFVGEKQALSAARESPLQIDRDGDVKDFYGTEKIAVEILLQRFYERTGGPGLRYTRRYLAQKDLELPEDVELPERGPGLLEKIRKSLGSLMIV